MHTYSKNHHFLGVQFGACTSYVVCGIVSCTIPAPLVTLCVVPAPMAERSKALSCPLAVIARRSLCPEKLGSNPGQGSKGINFSGWHGLDMSVTVTKRR